MADSSRDEAIRASEYAHRILKKHEAALGIDVGDIERLETKIKIPISCCPWVRDHAKPDQKQIFVTVPTRGKRVISIGCTECRTHTWESLLAMVGEEEEPPVVAHESKAPNGKNITLDVLLGASSYVKDSRTQEVFAELNRRLVHIRSEQYLDWAVYNVYQNTNRIINQSEVNEVRPIISIPAPEQPLGRRVQHLDGIIYIDLGVAGRAVRIGPEGWQIVDECPVRFLWAADSLPLPPPTRGGSLDDLWPAINVKVADRPLVLAWLLCSIAGIKPYPILWLVGPKAQGKSKAHELILGLVDPVPDQDGNLGGADCSLPREELDILLVAAWRHVVSFGNLSGNLPQTTSDLFCRLTSGGSLNKRRLYSDGDIVSFKVCCPMILNSIEDVLWKPDVLDRCFKLEIPYLDDAKRDTKARIDRAFLMARPGILGCLYDLIATGLRHREILVPEGNSPRLADAYEWVRACEYGQPLGMAEAVKGAHHKNQINTLLNSLLFRLLEKYVLTLKATGGIARIRRLDLHAALFRVWEQERRTKRKSGFDGEKFFQERYFHRNVQEWCGTIKITGIKITWDDSVEEDHGFYRIDASRYLAERRSPDSPPPAAHPDPPPEPDGPRPVPRPTPEGVACYADYEWDGTRLGGVVAFDTETRKLQEGRDWETPDLSLASASNGEVTVILPPSRVEEFLEVHRDCTFAGHNLAFDYQVIQKRFPWNTVLPEATEAGRIHDSMIAATLYNIATEDMPPVNQPLDRLAYRLCGIVLDKGKDGQETPIRLRYGELIGRDFNDPTIDPRFWTYAAEDAHATFHVHEAQRPMLRRIVDDHGLSTAWGDLTETIQFQAAVSLSAMRRNGMQIDLDKLKGLQDSLLASRDELIGDLRREAPQFLKWDKKTGEPVPTKTDGYATNTKAIQEMLEPLAPPGVQRDARGRVTVSKEVWKDILPSDHPVQTLFRLRSLSKEITVFTGLNHLEVHPNFKWMVRTGRTSCSQPNLQNLGRHSECRMCLIPREGYGFVSIDYSAIELRTLAQDALVNYGESALAELFRQGIDPHVNTAAAFAGLDRDGWNLLPEAEQKQRRQQAKALNFGVAGLYGPESLVLKSLQDYGVVLSLDEAQKFIDSLLELYPEMARMRNKNLAEAVAFNLRLTPDEIGDCFPDPWMLPTVRKCWDGRTDYTQRYGQLWDTLGRLNNNPEFEALFALPLYEAAKSNPDLDRTIARSGRQLWGFVSPTITGRIRYPVSSTQAANHPFQGLASDGYKLALWNLFRAGKHIVNAVHDEIVIEEPLTGGMMPRSLIREDQKIMEDSMRLVCPDVPITTEAVASSRWDKSQTLPILEDCQ